MEQEKGQIIINVVKIDDWDNAEITIATSPNVPKDYGFLMTAAEFLLNIAAQESPAGYERALDKLVAGAKTWKGKGVRQ